MRPETAHSIVLTFGTGLTAAISMVYAVYAGRLLGPAEYAHFTAAVAVVAAGNTLLGPINETVTRFTAQFAARGELGSVVGLLRAVLARLARYGLLAWIPAAVLLQPVATLLHFESVWPLVVAAATVFCIAWLGVARGTIRGLQRFGHYNVNILLEASTRLALGLVLLQLCGGAAAGLMAYPLAIVVALLCAGFQTRDLWRDHSAQPIDGSAVRRFTGPMFLLALASAGFQNIDLLLVKRYFPAEAAGHYGAAITLARSISVVVTPFAILVLPLVVHLHERGRSMWGALLRICAYFVVLAAGPVVMFGLWSDQIMTILYGAKFAEAGALLTGLAVARVAGGLADLVALACSARGEFRFLYVYIPALLAEGVILTLRHESLPVVIAVVIVVQVVTVLATVILAAWPVRRSGRAWT